MMRYKDAGVDISSLDQLKQRIKKLASGIGLFGGLYRFGEKVMVSSVDGVGTKLKVARMAGCHLTVGEDVVNHCINDIITLGAEPLFFLDYIAFTEMDGSVLAEIIDGLVQACQKVHLPLIGGETAQLPGYFEAGDYDLVGFITGIVDSDKLITGSKIKPGDILVGLTASGLHTNGYSLARKVFFEKLRYDLNHQFSELDRSLGAELLIPHRCYLEEIASVKDIMRGAIHITGGGFFGNIPRVLPEGLGAEIRKKAWEVPPIFELIRDLGDIPEEEMYRTFNMGIGMIIVAAPEDIPDIIDRTKGFEIGRVIEEEGVRIL